MPPNDAGDSGENEGVRGALPLIVAKDRQLRDMTAEAIHALESANTPPVIFRRNKALARVRPDEHGRPVIEEVDDKALRARLTDVADFGRLVKNPEATGSHDKGSHDKFIAKPMTPPDDLLGNILKQPDWRFPVLINITEAPVLRPDVRRIFV